MRCTAPVSGGPWPGDIPLRPSPSGRWARPSSRPARGREPKAEGGCHTLRGQSLARKRCELRFSERRELSLNQRTNIGVFVDTLDQDYQQQIVLGIDAEARSLDLDVACFAGGALDAPHPVQQRS